MSSVLSRWESLCASSSVPRFVDINLRGIGQVMFQDNPLSGALFLAAVAWGSFAAGVPEVLFGGLLAVADITTTETAAPSTTYHQSSGPGVMKVASASPTRTPLKP